MRVTGCAIFGIVSAFSYITPGSGSAQLTQWLTLQPMEAGALWGSLATLLLCVFYRWSLLDDFETPRLRETVVLARFLGTPLETRVGHVLYRLRLSVYEAERLRIRLTDMFRMLVFIEDGGFYRHNGNSLSA